MGGFEDDTALIRALVAYSGMTPAAISREIDVAKTTINRPYSGKATARLSGPTLAKLRERFPDFPGWTAEFEERMPFRQVRSKSGSLVIPDHDLIAVPMATLDDAIAEDLFASGAKQEKHIFPRAFIQMFTQSPADLLFFVHGIGDGMEPTFGDRNVLLIDRGNDQIRTNDQIWLVAVNGLGMVKRVRMADGKVRLMSDNANIPDQIVATQDLTVIGRVVACTRAS